MAHPVPHARSTDFRTQHVRRAAMVLAAILSGLLLGAILVAGLAGRLFDYRVLTVTSDSMAPAIRAGDLIIVRPLGIDAVRPGNIVVFHAGGDSIPTVHRVVGINEVELVIRDPSGTELERITERRLLTKGDNNPAPDPGEVTAASLVGSVWVTVPRLGMVAGLPLQYASLALAAATLCAWAAWELRRRFRSGPAGSLSR